MRTSRSERVQYRHMLARVCGPAYRVCPIKPGVFMRTGVSQAQAQFLPSRGWVSRSFKYMKGALGRIAEVNKELWVLLSMFVICLIVNIVVDGQRMVLSFYTLPTLASAYYYGRRHATLTALGSVLLVVLMTWFNPALFAAGAPNAFDSARWIDTAVWGGVLIVTGYSMGTLYEHKSAQIEELRDTYHGVLMILRHFIAKDTYTENHS